MLASHFPHMQGHTSTDIHVQTCVHLWVQIHGHMYGHVCLDIHVNWIMGRPPSATRSAEPAKG